MPNELQVLYAEILQKLPYSHPFLFVDELQHVSENGVKGNFTFSKDLEFYRGHFKDLPVTPGVILTECMAQIGVVSLGIYLYRNQISDKSQIALSSTNVDFYLPVFPGEKVTVTSEKKYFRFGKLKCKVEMHNAEEKLVCKGEIAGMIREE